MIPEKNLRQEKLLEGITLVVFELHGAVIETNYLFTIMGNPFTPKIGPNSIFYQMAQSLRIDLATLYYKTLGVSTNEPKAEFSVEFWLKYLNVADRITEREILGKIKIKAILHSDFMPTLELFRKNGIRTALFTNMTGELLKKSLQDTNIENSFDFFYDVQKETGALKDVHTYKSFLQKVGYSKKAEEVLYIGIDRRDSMIAQKAGSRFLLLDPCRVIKNFDNIFAQANFDEMFAKIILGEKNLPEFCEKKLSERKKLGYYSLNLFAPL